MNGICNKKRVSFLCLTSTPIIYQKITKPQVWYWSADDMFDTEISDARKWVNDYSLIYLQMFNTSFYRSDKAILLLCIFVLGNERREMKKRKLI